MKIIKLQIIDDQDHTETTLINSKGDKFTFNPLKHEGLDSFLSEYKLASDGGLADVSGFTAADVERAYNDGKADGEVQKDIPFNIEYYR